MDLGNILKFVVENKDLIAGIFGVFGLFGLGKNNFDKVKTDAVVEAEIYKKDLIKQGDLKVEDIEEKALDKAVTYFYDKFLTRFIPSWLIGFLISREKAEEMLENWYHQLKQVGLKKIDNGLNKI